MIRHISLLGAVLVIGLPAVLAACEKKTATRPGAKPPATISTGTKHDGHDHADGDKHDEHGPVVELGSVAVGSFQVKASRDGGITAGREAPVDLWVTSGAGAKVGAVRAWIGTQDANGSTKAKMDLEKDNYHNHVEVPKPLPTGSMLWIEIEDDKGVKALGSVDLKT